MYVNNLQRKSLCMESKIIIRYCRSEPRIVSNPTCWSRFSSAVVWKDLDKLWHLFVHFNQNIGQKFMTFGFLTQMEARLSQNQ